QAKEQGNIAIDSLICRAVHRQYLMLVRQQEIQHTEYTLFHLAGISTSANQNNFSRKVDYSKIRLPCAINAGIGLELRNLQDQPFLFKLFFLCFGRSNK